MAINRSARTMLDHADAKHGPASDPSQPIGSSQRTRFGGLLLAAVFLLPLSPTACDTTAENTAAAAAPEIVSVGSSANAKSLPTKPNEAPKTTSGAGGFQGVAWGVSERLARKRLMHKRVQPCLIFSSEQISPASRNEFMHPLHAIIDAVRSSERGSESQLTAMLGKLLYSDQRSGVNDLFVSVPVGPGCGLFFNNGYFGQLNTSQQSVDEQAIVAELSKTLGQFILIGGKEFFNKRSGSKHKVYRSESKYELVFLVYYENEIGTLYISKQMISSLQGMIDHEVTARAQREQANDQQRRRRNTARALSEL